jgi:hypothetical protein
LNVRRASVGIERVKRGVITATLLGWNSSRSPMDYPNSRLRNLKAQKTTASTANCAVTPAINSSINTDIARRSLASVRD